MESEIIAGWPVVFLDYILLFLWVALDAQSHIDPKGSYLSISRETWFWDLDTAKTIVPMLWDVQKQSIIPVHLI